MSVNHERVFHELRHVNFCCRHLGALARERADPQMNWTAHLVHLSARQVIGAICLVAALVLLRMTVGRTWGLPVLERLVGEGGQAQGPTQAVPDEGRA